MLSGSGLRCFARIGTTHPFLQKSGDENRAVENSQGTNGEDVDSHKMTREGEETLELEMICTICLENIAQETQMSRQDKVALLVQCGHFYHQSCLNNWLVFKEMGNRTCPTCRTEIAHDFEVKIITVDILRKDWKSIVRLRQKHALRRSEFNQRITELENSTGSSDEDEDNELRDMDWVHISLHPMEHTDPIAIQHQFRSAHTHHEEERSASPFTIITPDEIPSVTNYSSRSTFQPVLSGNDFLNWLDHNMFLAEPPSPYSNWIPMR